jgi:DNA-binding transcriptional regulator YhcF (GntR family)
MKLPKYQQVAVLVRDQVAAGTLAAGAPAPSGAALARTTGYSVPTCRRALRTLIDDGVLVRGVSRNARPRVPGHHSDLTLDEARRELSDALAGLRRAAGLTQPGLAAVTGDSVTAIGHAETGRVWNSRPFWERMDKTLNASGKLLRLHDAYRSAQTPPGSAAAAGEPAPATADTAEAPPATGKPPAPAVVLVVWSNGAVTPVPMTRDARRNIRAAGLRPAETGSSARTGQADDRQA